MRHVQAEIVPEPAAEERDAILAALDAPDAPAREAYRSPWRRDGLPGDDDESP